MTQSTFWSEEHLARASRSRDCGKDLLTLEGTSCSHILQSLNAIAPDGFVGRMSPAFCPATKDGTLEPSSQGWQNAGMGTPTGCLTLNSCEHASFPEPFPSGGGVSSLSDILETGDVPQRYFLTARACAGILRRAEKRGKALPEALRLALEAVATCDTEKTKTR